MTSDPGDGDETDLGRGSVLFIVGSVAVFLIIAGCVVYVVAKLV